MTAIPSFLQKNLPPLLLGASNQDYTVSRALAELYKGRGKGPISASRLRNHVAALSPDNKLYLANGAQQDAGELLRCLLDRLEVELNHSEIFTSLLSKLYGRTVEQRKFLDNPPTGKCVRCGQFPASVDKPFLFLKLTVPSYCDRVKLDSLVDNHFSENDDEIMMKCSECCPHPGSSCPHTGFCRRPAVTQLSFTKTPQYLFVQLLRYGKGVTGGKVTTLVEAAAEMELHSTDKYELVGALNHQGNTISSGHFVSYVRSENGPWLLCNDTSITTTYLDKVISADNYILLYSKVKAHTIPEFIPTTEWQEVLPGQSVPPGCHTQINMGGKNSARLDPTYTKPDHLKIP